MVERLIMRRFFSRKLGLPHLVPWMTDMMHKLVYAEDILLLNAANKDTKCASDTVQAKGSQLLSVALPTGVPETKRFETKREVIYESVREGFAAAYNTLVLDAAERGRGMEIAHQVYPDRVMADEPKHMQRKEEKEST